MGAAEGEMVRQHYWLNGHEFEQTLKDSGRQRSLACSILQPTGLQKVKHDIVTEQPQSIKELRGLGRGQLSQTSLGKKGIRCQGHIVHFLLVASMTYFISHCHLFLPEKKKEEGPRVCIENGGHWGRARSLKQEE